MAHRNPITFPYNNIVDTCCRALADAGEAPSDIQLVHSIHLQKISEAVASTFHYDTVTGQHLSIEMIQTLIPWFERQLRELESSFPPHKGPMSKL